MPGPPASGVTVTWRTSPSPRYQPIARTPWRKLAWPWSPMPGWSRPAWLYCSSDTRNRVKGFASSARWPRCSSLAYSARSPTQLMTLPASVISSSPISSRSLRRHSTQLGSPTKLMVWSARNDSNSGPSSSTSPANGKAVAGMSSSGAPWLSMRWRRDDASRTSGALCIAATSAATQSGASTSSSCRNFTYSPWARAMPRAVLPSSPRRLGLRS
ncbi:hypothetical protein NB705_001147 [Xanthomonas sacchari]|nr:hypothetical protein [Xanthomonas sacchari]